MKFVPWSKKEVALLVELFRRDYSEADAAEEINRKIWKGATVRTCRSVEKKIERLRKKNIIGYKRNPADRSNFEKGHLSKKNRALLDLIDEGYSMAMAAEKLGIPLGSVKSSMNFLRSKGFLTGKVASSDNRLREEILQMVKVAPLSVGEISRRIDRSKETVIRLIDELRHKGFDIDVLSDTKQVTLSTTPQHQFAPLVFKKLYHYNFKIGVISDLHFGSKYSQMTLLRTAYKICDEENVDFILIPGDITDGIKVYKGQMAEMFLFTADDIVDYAVKHIPESKKKIKSYIIPGNHDYSFKKEVGYNIVRTICDRRDDLVYRGEKSALFDVKGVLIHLLHPMGGLSYALSYKVQKIMENIVANAVQTMREVQDYQRIPKVMAFGHYHKYFQFVYAGSLVLASPCMQAQTPYLRDKGLTPDVGMLVINLTFDKNWNIVKVVPDVRIMNHLVKENDY